MSTTAQGIIEDALQAIRVYGVGETVAPVDLARGLSTLNTMVDSWSNESLACYEILEQSGLLIPGQAAYTIGPGGNFNMTRPIRLIDGPGAAYVQDSNGNNYMCDVVPRDKWNLLGNRTNTVNSNFPNTIFYDPQFPLGVINFYPFPNMGYTAFWDSYLQLVDFTSLSSPLNLPPGYEAAFKKQLALILEPYYPSAVITPSLMEAASKALANIKRSNIRPNEAVYDAELVSRVRGQYNPFTDSMFGSRGS